MFRRNPGVFFLQKTRISCVIIEKVSHILSIMKEQMVKEYQDLIIICSCGFSCMFNPMTVQIFSVSIQGCVSDLFIALDKNCTNIR